MKMNKLLALTLGLALGLMICAFACAQEGESVGLSAIPEIPAELIAEIPAAYVEEPSAEPAQTPSIPVVLPAVENSQEFVPPCPPTTRISAAAPACIRPPRRTSCWAPSPGRTPSG